MKTSNIIYACPRVFIPKGSYTAPSVSIVAQDVSRSKLPISTTGCSLSPWFGINTPLLTTWATDGYINLSNSPLLNFTWQPFTLSAWVMGDLTEEAIFNKVSAAKTEGILWYIDANGAVLFRTFQAGGSQASYTANSVVTLDRWKHLVVVRSGTSVRLYANGVDITSVAGVHIDPDSSLAVTAYWGKAGNTYISYNWYGQFALQKIYSVALDPSQVAALYNEEKSLIDPW